MFEIRRDHKRFETLDAESGEVRSNRRRKSGSWTTILQERRRGRSTASPTSSTWRGDQQLCRGRPRKRKYLTTWVEVHSLADYIGLLGVFAGTSRRSRTRRNRRMTELVSLGDGIRAATQAPSTRAISSTTRSPRSSEFEFDDPATRQAWGTVNRDQRQACKSLSVAAGVQESAGRPKAREEYAERARITADLHRDKFEQLSAWIASAEKY